MQSRYTSFFLTEETIMKRLNEWVEKIRLQNSFLDNLTLTYEFEYKYSKIVSTYMMNEKRKENILKEIEDRMEPIFESVIHDMLFVYSGWLKEHKMYTNMQDKKGWVKESYKDVIHNVEDFRNLLMAEYISYSKRFTKGYKQSEYDLLMTLDNKKDLADFAVKKIYPMWYGIWSHSSMKDTYKRIKSQHENLLKAQSSSMSFKEKQTTINIALNTMHQTGSMKFHIANFLDCEEKDLDRLSNLPNSVIKKWNEDLVEMGIY